MTRPSPDGLTDLDTSVVIEMRAGRRQRDCRFEIVRADQHENSCSASCRYRSLPSPLLAADVDQF
jgi:hypothetical protein